MAEGAFQNSFANSSGMFSADIWTRARQRRSSIDGAHIAESVSECRHCDPDLALFQRRFSICQRNDCAGTYGAPLGEIRNGTIVCTSLCSERMVLHDMKPSIAFHAHRDAIRRIVEGHGARNPRVFGSVAQGSDTEDSDLDILVDPTPETTLFDIGAIRHELLQLLGVPVDVLTPNALPEKFRDTVLAEAVVL